jgi:hypothetical protein
MNGTIDSEFIALRDKVETQGKEMTAQGREISEIKGGLQQLDKIVSATTRQSVWQLVVLVVSLCGAIIAGLAYQTAMLEKRIEQLERSQNQRADAIEKRIEQSEKSINARFEQSEKNITARFEDLKQEVRARRK